MTTTIALAAGGTGGHLFPAEALATELKRRGHDVILFTDHDARTFESRGFANAPVYPLSGGGIVGKSWRLRLVNILRLIRGFRKARRIFASSSIDAIVGFGGYPSVAPILAAATQPRARRPRIILHEGNAVLGTANAYLARVADDIATSFPAVARLPKGCKTLFTGMPVRSELSALNKAPYTPPDDDIRLLIWGGSLGARVLSQKIPKALAQLPDALRSRLRVTHQVHESDREHVQECYRAAAIEATIAPFFTNIAELLAKAHLVIGRAGGSSVAELTLAGRPSILIPLPNAVRREQDANALQLKAANAAWVIEQSHLDEASVCALLTELFTSPSLLVEAASSAARLAKADSASQLADLIDKNPARRGTPQ